MQGPHHVAQTLTRRSLLPSFLTSALMPFSSIISRATFSFVKASDDFCTAPRFSAHLIEQPKVFVCSTGTGLPANRATMASRVSWEVTRSGSEELSIRPTNRSFRSRSKINTCGVAVGPYANATFLIGAVVQIGKIEPFVFRPDLHFVQRIAEVGVAHLVEPQAAGSFGEIATNATLLFL